MENTAYRNAMEVLARRRREAENDAARRREELYRALPQLLRYDGEAAGLCRQMTAAVLNGEPTEPYQHRLEQVRQDKLRALSAVGVEEQMLQPRYHCALCRDTGFTEGRRCRCLNELLQKEAMAALPAGVFADCRGFEGFDLTYYSDAAEPNGRSPRDTMRNILGRCRRYAAEFTPDAGNLLFMGRTGLGKTYRSACMAAEVVARVLGKAEW